VHRAVFAQEHSPHTIIVVVGGALLVGLVRRLRLEGALDVVLYESALPERVLDRDLVVRARCIQDPLEMVPGRCGPGLIALGVRHLALHRRHEVVVTATLVVLLLIFEALGRPLAVVHNLFPLSLRGVERRNNCLLAISMVARDVEELAGRARHAAPESVDKGGAGRPVLKRRDGVVVDRAGELGAGIGEVSYALVETLPRLLFAVA
jgi:hypothetical protein